MTNQEFLTRLVFWSKLRPKEVLYLIKRFKKLEKLFDLKYQDFSKLRIKSEYFQELQSFINSKEFKTAPEVLKKHNIKSTTFVDSNYPEILKEISSYPLVLFYYGNLPKKSEICISIVGTRKMTPYGKQACEKIVSELIHNGISVVSGLALGIDSQVAKTAIENKGKTYAVLGNGLTQIYPISNKNLAREIIKTGGGIISEFSPFTPSLKQNFPQRNRIISGLSVGTVIIEAAEQSGSLITGSFALEQNRLVYAVPGSIFSEQSKGTNNLIKLGAKPITSITDILEDLGIEYGENQKGLEKEIEFDNLEQEKIYNQLFPERALHIDKISKLVDLDLSTTTSNLMSLEIKGVVKNIGAGKYVKVN